MLSYCNRSVAEWISSIYLRQFLKRIFIQYFREGHILEHFRFIISPHFSYHGPLTIYVKFRVAQPRASVTHVAHVPWCVPGSLTSVMLWSRWPRNVPGILGVCATRNYAYVVRGPCPKNRYMFEVTAIKEVMYNIIFEVICFLSWKICTIQVIFRSSHWWNIVRNFENSYWLSI